MDDVSILRGHVRTLDAYRFRNTSHELFMGRAVDDVVILKGRGWCISSEGTWKDYGSSLLQ